MTGAASLPSVEQTLAALLAQARPLSVEEIPLAAALGRVLAAPVHAAADVPTTAVSAMDGYALRAADAALAGTTTLPVAQRITAGDIPGPLAPGTAARLFTGAPLPPGADTVMAQEDCRAADTAVSFDGPVAAGRHVRPAGEDIAAGSVAVPAGVRLSPPHLGMVAAAGRDCVAVHRRPRVAVACTGNELLAPGHPPAPGKLYNSNLYLLTGLLQRLGCDVTALGIVPDSLQATCAMLTAAAAGADTVITTGGASVGEEDYVKAALQEVGEQALWRVAMRPGRPLIFGHVAGVPFFGLPGNPVSALVTCALFVRPFVLRRQGAADVTPVALRLPAAFGCRAAAGRRHYMRARLTARGDGVTAVEVFPNQSSGVLSSTTWAQGLAVAREGRDVHPGDLVEYIPFSSLFD